MRKYLRPAFCGNRRRLLCLAAGAAALPAVSRFAWAQAYPTRPVRIIVPLAPAGTSDIIARLMGQWLSERLGQQFVVENRTGAGTTLGTEAVVRAVPDGYTLLMADVSAAFNAMLYDKLNFNFIRDIAPVAHVVRVPNVIAVHPSFPTKTVPEFIAHARANPGKVSMATAGIGSLAHVFGELFKIMADVDLVAVPYRGGGPALVGMLSGHVDVIFVPTTASIEYVRAGRLRALGVTSTTRAARSARGVCYEQHRSRHAKTAPLQSRSPKVTARPSSPTPARWASKALSRSGRIPPTVPGARPTGSK